MQLFLSHELRIPDGRSLPAAELRACMEERFARAVSLGQAVSALACEPLGLERVERQSPGLAPLVLNTLTLALEPAFRASEAVAYLEAPCLVVLLVGHDPRHMEAACQLWIAGAKELRIEGLDGPLRLSLRIGYGVPQPGKRLFLDTLIHVARAGLDVARCRGSAACVHTMTYDIVQDRLERERGTRGVTLTASAPLTAGSAAREPLVGAEVRPGIHVATPPPDASGSGLPGGTAVLARRERELADALEAQRRENAALRARLRALETRDDVPGGMPHATEGTVAAPSEPMHMLRMDLLERRLAKVTRTLAEAEERLARSSREDAVDPGIPSCYHTVQGLAADAPQRALRAALMQQIFEANLALHERLRYLGQDVAPAEIAPGLEHR